MRQDRPSSFFHDAVRRALTDEAERIQAEARAQQPGRARRAETPLSVAPTYSDAGETIHVITTIPGKRPR